MTTYFTDNSFKYLQELAHHNDKIWFTAHKPQYIEHVQTPFLRLITDLQPCLADISEHYRADPRPQGGSLFRIYRDARFSKDKSPYKTWQGARLFHARRREVPTPPLHTTATGRKLRRWRNMATSIRHTTPYPPIHL